MAFDIFALVAGTTHPEDDVEIYMDNAAAYRVRKIEETLNRDRNLTDKEIAALEKEEKDLQKRLDASKVTVHLRGITQDRAAEIRDKTPEKEDKLYDARMIREHWVYATDSNGEKSDISFTDDQMVKLLSDIPEESRMRLTRKVVELTFESANFEAVERSADFS